jgi:hypothetical protein
MPDGSEWWWFVTPTIVLVVISLLYYIILRDLAGAEIRSDVVRSERDAWRTEYWEEHEKLQDLREKYEELEAQLHEPTPEEVAEALRSLGVKEQ